MATRGELCCVHIQNSGYTLPRLRVLNDDGITHQYLCRDCYDVHTRNPNRKRKDFVTKRFHLPRKLERELIALHVEAAVEAATQAP